MKHATYNGENGEFIQGVPARDLTKEEWDSLGEILQRRCLDSGLYSIDSKKASGKKPESDTGR